MEKKFKHARDFGIEAPRGKKGFNDFDKALKDFTDDPQTVTKGGTYRGDPVMLRYNADSRLVVLQKPDGSFVSGWKMDPRALVF